MSTALKAFFAQSVISQEEMGEGNPEFYEGVAPVTDAELIDDQIDIDEASSEYDESDELVTDMDGVVVGLEGLVEAMEASLEHGGLSNHSAVFAHREAGLHLQRLGMEASQVMVSVESFGGAHERIEATQVSVEGLKETIQKLKKASGDAFARMATAQKNFWGKILEGVKGLQGRIVSAEATIADLKGKTAEGTVTIIGGKVLSHGGAVSVKGIISGLKSAEKVGSVLYGSYVDTAEKYYNQVVGMYNKEGEGSGKDVNNATAAYHKNLVTVIQKSGEEIIGGYRLEQITISGSSWFGKDAGEVEEVAPKWERAEKVSGEGRDVDVPSPAELKQIVAGVKGVVAVALSKADALVKLSDVRVKALSNISESRAATALAGNSFTAAVVMSGITKSIGKDVAKPVKQYATIVYPACRTALQFVESAAKKYKAPKAAE